MERENHITKSILYDKKQDIEKVKEPKGNMDIIKKCVTKSQYYIWSILIISKLSNYIFQQLYGSK